MKENADYKPESVNAVFRLRQPFSPQDILVAHEECRDTDVYLVNKVILELPLDITVNGGTWRDVLDSFSKLKPLPEALEICEDHILITFDIYEEEVKGSIDEFQISYPYVALIKKLLPKNLKCVQIKWSNDFVF